jgi:hypothetical protein
MAGHLFPERTWPCLEKALLGVLGREESIFFERVKLFTA